MKRLLVILCIGLVFCNVCYGSIDRKCKEGDPNCVDFDYHFEEAAKEMVLDHSNKTSYTLLSNLTVHGRTNASKVSDNESLKTWWKEWYHATMQLHKINPDQYARPLCKPFKMKEKFMECNETSSSTQACIETRNMTIVQCDGYGDSQFLIPICKEKSSSRVVTCGVLSTFVCYPFEENKPPIKPCNDPFQQICLSKNGSLVKCTQANFLSNLNVEFLLKNTIKDTPVWWRKGKRPNLELEEKFPGNESVTLCLSNEAKDQLRFCNETETRTTACFNTNSGELAGCKHFTESEMIVPICSEVSSNRIQSCDKSKKEFLCFSPGNVKKPIQSCENGGHYICLNNNGLLDKCSNSSTYDKSNHSSEELGNAINSSKAWEDWWAEWVSNIPVTKEEEDMFLCKSSENLMKCDQRLSDAKACASAKSGKIDLCKKLNESDLPITLCTKGSMNKIISCSDYGSAYLCFDGNTKRNFIRPCRSENRHLCLTDAGLVKSCSALNPPEESGISGNITLPKDDSLHWNRVWEVLFPITQGLENNLREDKALCITKEGYIFECLDTFSGNTVCVGANAGKIGDCTDIQSKESPVPICREKSSERVVVCGERSLFPCESSDGKSSFYYPCKSPSHQLCLTHEGLLEKCRRRSISENSAEMELRITSNKFITIIKAMEGFKSAELMYLCKNGSVVLPCSDRFLYPKACLNTKIGKIQPCENIERYHTAGLPVCIHVNTSKLFTCGEYSESALCFPRSGKMHPLSPCKMNLKNACITAEGKLVKCTKSQQNFSHYYDEKVTPTSLIEKERIYSEYEQKNIIPLCLQQDTEMPTECESDPTINFACLSLKKGVMHSCLHAKPYNLSIPLCLKGASKFVVTCGKFNHVNLCQDKKPSIYTPCNRVGHFLCFKNGLLSRCQAKYFNYRENDRYSKKFLGDLKEAEDYQVSGYQNSKTVYEFESRSIQAGLKNCVRLCEVYEDKNVLRSCDDDPSINFACFGVNEGSVKSCSTFGPTELIMPVCVEKTNRVVTHGKFFKTYLCFQDNGDGIRIDTCTAKNEHICLTKKGSLEKCDHSEAEISSKLRKGSQKGERSSTEQSTIKSEFNANINETPTSKENEMFEDNSEEITNEDYTEKLKAILGIKSNKKSSRVSKSKQKYNAESDKEQKGNLEEPEENVKNKKKENKNHEEEKRSHLKKNYNKNKEQKGAKKSKKGNSESRIRKSINEYKNAISTIQSMGELRDVGDEYEYYLDDSNNVEKVGNESNEQNYSDINVEGILKSMHLVYQDLLQEYKIKHRQAIIEKELKQISSIHMISRHLCKVRTDSDKLVDCDSDPHLRFACVGAREGKLRRCNEFKKTDVPFPVCFQANSRNLVTCDIFSNVQLNLMGSDREACLGDNGLPVECGNHVTRRSSSMEQFQVPHPDDENFFRLLCTNCSIENRFILEGKPQDVLPTLEVFTYPPK